MQMQKNIQQTFFIFIILPIDFWFGNLLHYFITKRVFD